jgi:hypothetical protein
MAYLTITGVILPAFKENWNPLIHLSLEIERELFYKGKGLWKGIPAHAVLKFWYVRLTIDNVTSLSPNHRHSHMPPSSTLTFT